ncbi:MAG: bifunctional UDP-N-acetylglucosamine diphosphorylase/glucosamine-1-phosphate N-acetyltransferase GlmU [Acidobacteriota bacterium]|nr:bifunctional UDP-N-acetylglucosamine diphosphorylase/glucosamine-1-phosphate N-acetyltransferase GlmU [Acidobacteriota bacterium]
MNQDISVVILAAGLGTRMRSKRAKVLHRAGGLTLIEHVVKMASHITSPDRITVVVGHQGDQVRATLTKGGSEPGVQFVEQVQQHGTGDALKICRPAVAGRSRFVLVVYGDCPMLSAETIQRLIDRQIAGNSAATLITTKLPDPRGYGRVILNEQGNVEGIVEQKAATPKQLEINLINSGIYCFRDDLLWKYIDEIVPNNPAREYYLTDMADILTRAGHTLAPMEVDDSFELLGINNRVELAELDRIFRNRKARELMLDGVTIEKPETVTIDAQVRIGMDTIIGPFAQVLGDTVIGEDCRIGAGAIIQNSQIGDAVEILPLTIVAASRLDSGAHVGPFARLRMQNHVESGAHIGNFVELKKTHLGAGAKASHLAYLGDSEIGAKANIGAGTITCNYDGVLKHHTKVGAGAFVGSNSTLVAPVVVGDGSYIGAGSVITKQVPPEALALGRSHQIIKPGWVAKRKAQASE